MLQLCEGNQEGTWAGVGGKRRAPLLHTRDIFLSFFF